MKSFVFASIAGALALTGCASATRTSPEAPAKILKPADYDVVYVTGSNLPYYVPKSETAAPLPLPSDVTVMSSDQFRDLVRRGQTTSRH